MTGGRLLIVSNRLPVTAAVGEDGGVRMTAASGGLATGLRSWYQRSGGLWIGWPGDVAGLTIEQGADLDRQLAERSLAPVWLTRDDIEQSYLGFANRVLWPLFHYLIDRVPVHATGWDAYGRANQAFADEVVRHYRPGDAIWIHDYHLMLLPALLRRRLPAARIGFFLHIPFPSSEVFRTLPWRREVLAGLLGADLVGFHTYAYMRHFLASLLHVEGVEADVDRVRVGTRTARIGVFPMGVDAAAFSTMAADADVRAEVDAIRHEAGDRRILLGIDRLDYTKGIPRRLQSIERLLHREPHLRDAIRYIQVAVPSRIEVDTYQRFRRDVEEQVGRINGQCGTVRSTPVHYIHRAVEVRQLVALYCAADVMLVTPLRDGMNLVAKEFVASRRDEDGVLVLSEFAGAAAELDGAVVVNPYDVEGVAQAIQHALAMPAAERRARMRSLRRRVREHDVSTWAREFLRQLGECHAEPPAYALARSEESLANAIAEARGAAGLRLLLDYDGTLVPLARAPELAAPDEELLDLIVRLTDTPGLDVEIVSGRPRDTLEAWLGHLPVVLWAEHGFWRRARRGDGWEAAAHVAPDWMQRIAPILQQFTASTPGSRLEIKRAAVAWHFRGAQREFGARQAHELRLLLGDALSNQPLEVLEGKKVIEVRFRGLSKAVVAQENVTAAPRRVIIAFGDDRTDEDLFRALPASAITVAVGHRLVGARYWVEDPRAVRRVLRSLLVEPVGADARTGTAGVV
jgi:trehalose 6-phosphate synthase/phosphatase